MLISGFHAGFWMNLGNYQKVGVAIFSPSTGLHSIIGTFQYESKLNLTPIASPEKVIFFSLMVMTNNFFLALLFSLNAFMVLVCILVGVWSRETALENDFPHFRHYNNYFKNKKNKKPSFSKIDGIIFEQLKFFFELVCRRLSDDLKVFGVITDPSTSVVLETPRFYRNARHHCFFRFFNCNKHFFLDFTGFWMNLGNNQGVGTAIFSPSTGLHSIIGTFQAFAT